MRRRPQSPVAPVHATVSPETEKSEELALPKKAATWLGAAVDLSTLPA